ncbi:MAG: hypothetical protein M3Y26_09425 [Actinomycetota bacterium]|nr:hypothetical protein [Actinomycetota bacterium]
MPATRSPLITAALVLAAVGILAIVAAFIWAAVAGGPPLALYLLALLLPAAMVVAAVGVARDYRGSRQPPGKSER